MMMMIILIITINYINNNTIISSYDIFLYSQFSYKFKK